MWETDVPVRCPQPRSPARRQVRGRRRARACPVVTGSSATLPLRCWGARSLHMLVWVPLSSVVPWAAQTEPRLPPAHGSPVVGRALPPWDAPWPRRPCLQPLWRVCSPGQQRKCDWLQSQTWASAQHSTWSLPSGEQALSQQGGLCCLGSWHTHPLTSHQQARLTKEAQRCGCLPPVQVGPAKPSFPPARPKLCCKMVSDSDCI